MPEAFEKSEKQPEAEEGSDQSGGEQEVQVEDLDDLKKRSPADSEESDHTPIDDQQDESVKKSSKRDESNHDDRDV